MEGAFQSDLRSATNLGLGSFNRNQPSDLMVPKQPRESGVLSEAERLGRAVSEHEQALTLLLSRIEPVVRNEPSGGVGNGGAAAPEAALCHVGDAIRAERRRLEAMSSILRDIAKRIDL